MRNRAFGTVVLVIAIFALAALQVLALSPPALAAEPVSIVRLIDNMARYNGKEVTIRGEVIGDLMVRGAYAWITVNDDHYSEKSIEEGGPLVGMSNAGIGVWVPEADTRDIKTLGGYKNKGCKVVVTGVFHRACPEHGGDTDIHATSVEVIRPGYPFSHPFKWGELLAIIMLSGVIALLWFRLRARVKRVAKEE
jgi:hypothetical protein